MQIPDEKTKLPKTIVIFGSAETGKSCIIKQFLNQTFEHEYHATIEDVFNRKYVVNGIELDVQFIDTGGLYNFPAMRTLCIKKAAGFILVFAVNQQESLYYLTEVLDQINSIHSTENEQEELYTTQMPVVVVGNKCDLINTRSVRDEEVHLWLKESQLKIDQFVLTSAKEEDGVWDAFSSLYFQFIKHCPALDTCESKQCMASSIRRLSAFAALAVSPTQQFKTFFSSQINPDLIKYSSEASSSLSSPGGTSPNFPIGNNNSVHVYNFSRFKRNSRPSLSKISKENPKSGRAKGPIKVDCVLS